MDRAGDAGLIVTGMARRRADRARRAITMIARISVLAGLAGASAAPVLAQALTYRIVPEAVGDGIWMIRGTDGPIEMANGGAIAI